MANKLVNLKFLAPTKIHTGTLIFLHGSGDTGHGVRSWIKLLLGKDFTFPHLRVIYPTAPLMPYTPNDGEPSNVWFDRPSISPEADENLDSIENMSIELNSLIQEEIAAGIPIDRIIIGGFSMGGAMAMHMGFRYQRQFAGLFALSSFLNYNSAVYESLKDDKPDLLPQFFMCHGDDDRLVLHKWGKETFKKLQEYEVDGQFHTLEDAGHELEKDELLKLYDWINERIPEN